MTELELAAEMEYRMNKYGANGRSFSTIVGFGPHSAEPHYQAGDAKLTPGVSMVCDFGAYYRRYACDITRSFHFGRRDEELKQVHDAVEAAQQAALALLRPGVPGKDVHQAAENVINATKWKGRFNHGLGHALGLAVHDGGPGPLADVGRGPRGGDGRHGRAGHLPPGPRRRPNRGRRRDHQERLRVPHDRPPRVP